MKISLKCRIFGHKLGWEIFEKRPCRRIGCDHVGEARDRAPCPPMPKFPCLGCGTKKEKPILENPGVICTACDSHFESIDEWEKTRADMLNPITDKQRIDFIESLASRGSPIEIRDNTLIGNQPKAEENPVQIFTIEAQHQHGKTAREVIDIAMEFESGERNWKKENWPEHLWDRE